MASICNLEKGRRAIQFAGDDGRRRTVRLGKMSRKHAEEILRHVEELVAARRSGKTPSDRTQRWLLDMDATLHGRLVRVGLTGPRDGGGLTVERWLDRWLETKSSVTKPGTVAAASQAKRLLLEYFPADKPLAELTEADAQAWAAWLRRGRERPLSEATARRRVSHARSAFRWAIAARRAEPPNVFDGLKASGYADESRQAYVDPDEADRVADELLGRGELTTVQLRTVFALARWAGLRVPSEPKVLRWTDVDFDRNRLHVDSPKTGPRTIPIVPRLRDVLLEAFGEAEDGAEHVVPFLRNHTGQALRSPMLDAIRRAGLTPWPKVFHTLRASCESDWADDFPLHVVTKWSGNSRPVALRHYLRTTDAHYRAAAEGRRPRALQKAVQQPAARGRNDSQGQRRPDAEDALLREFARNSDSLRSSGMGDTGLEPVTSSL